MLSLSNSATHGINHGINHQIDLAIDQEIDQEINREIEREVDAEIRRSFNQEMDDDDDQTNEHLFDFAADDNVDSYRNERGMLCCSTSNQSKFTWWSWYLLPVMVLWLAAGPLLGVALANPDCQSDTASNFNNTSVVLKLWLYDLSVLTVAWLIFYPVDSLRFQHSLTETLSVVGVVAVINELLMVSFSIKSLADNFHNCSSNSQLIVTIVLVVVTPLLLAVVMTAIAYTRTETTLLEQQQHSANHHYQHNHHNHGNHHLRQPLLPRNDRHRLV